MAMIRTFVAVDIPEWVQRRLVSLQSDLAHRISTRVQWVTGPRLHITLRFLGEISSEQISLVEEAAKDVTRSRPPFDLELEGFGLFPPSGSPRVFWVGIGAGGAETKQLAYQLDQHLELLGFAPRDEAELVPHLTLARLKPAASRSEWESAISQLEHHDLGRFPVQEILVMRSDLTQHGPIYSVLARVPLG